MNYINSSLLKTEVRRPSIVGIKHCGLHIIKSEVHLVLNMITTLDRLVSMVDTNVMLF